MQSRSHNVSFCEETTMPFPKPIKGRLLAIFAKQPVAGEVKTRLGQATSSEWAARVAQASLEDSLDRFAAVAAERVIVFAPTSANHFFARLADGRFECVPQDDGDLGRRLQRFFQPREPTASRGSSPSAPTARRCPSSIWTRPSAYWSKTTSCSVLRSTAATISSAPATRKSHCSTGFPGAPPVSSKRPSSGCASAARLALLPPWYDIDTADDWAMLRGHVLAMRQAGLDPGVPRIEALIQEQIP